MVVAAITSSTRRIQATATANANTLRSTPAVVEFYQVPISSPAATRHIHVCHQFDCGRVVHIGGQLIVRLVVFGVS